jgi:hypothetical protein
VKDLYQSDIKADPMQIAMDRWSGTNGNVILRLEPIPSSTIWRIYFDYQLKPAILTTLSATFTPIPDDMGRLLRQTYLAMALKYADDRRQAAALQEAQMVLDSFRGVYDAETHAAPAFVPAMSITDMYR